MDLSLAITGPGGHTEVLFEDDKVVVKFKNTSPAERGAIEQLVEKGRKIGLVLHRSKKEEATKPFDDIKEVVMDKKGEIALKGKAEDVEKLAVALIEKEIKDGRVVAEAQEDGQWKILEDAKLFKPRKDKKQALTSTKVPVGG
jgi:hypothetical protein